jgi:hypothetical protein
LTIASFYSTLGDSTLDVSLGRGQKLPPGHKAWFVKEINLPNRKKEKKKKKKYQRMCMCVSVNNIFCLLQSCIQKENYEMKECGI